MSRYDDIDTLITSLGESATVEEVEFALRDHLAREVIAVLADRAAAGGGGAALPEEWGLLEGGGLIVAMDEDTGWTIQSADGATSDVLALKDGNGDTALSVGQTNVAVGGTESQPATITLNPSTGIRLYADVNNDNNWTIRCSPGQLLGFYGTAPAAKPTGVAVTAEAIHAALVTLGLIEGP